MAAAIPNHNLSSRHSGDLLYLPLQSRNTFNGTEDIEPPQFINHGVIHGIYERLPNTVKCTVDKRDSEPSNHVREARFEFVDAQQKFLEAYASLRETSEGDEKLQSEIIDLVGLINRLKGVADGVRDHEKVTTQSVPFGPNALTSHASSVNSTSNAIKVCDESDTLPTPVPVTIPNCHNLMARLLELTNERRKSCELMEMRLLDVQFYSRLREQTFMELNRLRIKSACDRTTELRDIALEFMFGSKQQVDLGRKIKRKREDTEAGEGANIVETTETAGMGVAGRLEHVNMGDAGPPEATEHEVMGQVGPAEGTKHTEIMTMEGSDDGEDSDDGGVLLTASEGPKEEGGKKKRRRKRKKAGRQYIKGVVPLTDSKPEHETVVKPQAENVLPDVVAVPMPDARAADNSLADDHLANVDAIPETPLVLPTHSHLTECTAKATTHGAEAITHLPPAEPSHGHEQDQEKSKEQKTKRTPLSRPEASENNCARGDQAREEQKMRQQQRSKTPEEDRVLGEIQGVDEEGMLTWGQQAAKLAEGWKMETMGGDGHRETGL